MAIVSLRKYGEMRGVSGEAVRKAIKSGRLVNAIRYNDKGQPCVDADIADREWVKNTDGSQQRKTDNGHRLSAYAQPVGVSASDEKQVMSGGVPPIDKSKAIREAYQARLAKLEYEKESGSLIDAEQVKLELFTAGRSIRDAVMAVVDGHSAKLASITDPHRVHAELYAALASALDRVIPDAT